jgi:tRNA dimethylallyltransferase
MPGFADFSTFFSLRTPMPRAILLMGPTASGKTALACALAGRFPVGLVSVDSALVYKGMDIGTAKPDAATLARYPHRLVDLVTPEERYSAARFCVDAEAAMAEIEAEGKVPLLVGGTMLYFKALMEGLADLPQADEAVRQAIEARARQLGWPALHAELARLDPETARRLAPGDSQRIGRALEICEIAGRPMSAILAGQKKRRPAREYLPLALLPADRGALHGRIAERFHAMLAMGLIEEVEGLRKKYRLNADLPSMRCVGYRQAWAYLEGELPKGELAYRGIAATRQLAKRQLTWLVNSFAAEAFDCLDAGLEEKAARRIEAFLR